MRDLRFAWRAITNHRWFSAAVVLTLAVGIGINATVFTLSGAVLFKSLPFPDGDRIVVVGGANLPRNVRQMDVSHPDFVDLRAQTTSFELLEAVIQTSAVLGEPDHPPERFPMARVTTGFFRAFRTEAVLGRGFGPGDAAPGAPPVAVISYNVWRNRYTLAASVIGTSVRINEQPATIVGVMPPGFGLPELEEVWIPLVPTDPTLTDRTDRALQVFGLLKPGVTRGMARADVSAVTQRLQAAYPVANQGVTGTVLTFHDRFVGGKGRTMFSLMLGAVALVLLIACANIANMMLSRAMGRHRDVAIRSALGASRWRIVRQLLVECLVLSAAGGVLGLVIAVAGVRAFDHALTEAGKPSWIVFTVDFAVLAYVAAICVMSALLFGLAPALRISRVDLNHALKEGGRGGSGRVSRLSGTLVVLQFAFAVVLLTAAGLLMRSFVAGQNINAWVPQSQIMTARVELPASRYPDRDARIRFFDAALDRLAALPGVQQRGLTSHLPALGSGRRRIELEGATISTPADRSTVAWLVTSPRYFDTIGLPIVRGRAFDDRDGTLGSEAVIISAACAARFWPHGDAVGKRFRFNAAQTPDPWMTVVGVSGDIVQASQQATADPVAFVPYRQADPTTLVLAVRTSGDATTLTNPLRVAIQAMDKDLAPSNVRTIEALVYAERWPYRIFGSIFGCFALSALFMAAVGLYAVMSQSTSRRTREIGIRMALGATPSRILRVVMRAGAIQLGTGLTLGVAAAWAVSGQMETLLLGVVPGDPVTLILTSLLLLLVGLLSCWIPAHRAALIAPLQALNQDERAG